MKKILLAGLLLGGCLPLAAQGLCDISAQRPIQLLETELNRSFKTLKKQKPSIYYLSYTYTQTDEQALSVAEGGIAQKDKQQDAYLQVMARAGSPKMDNTRTLKIDYDDFYQPQYTMPELSGDGKAFRTAVWRATQEAAERAQESFSRVQADSVNAAKRSDDSNDFVFPPKSTYCRTEAPLSFDLERIKALLLKASEQVQGSAFVLDSSFSFTVSQGSRYFVDSVGTRLKTPFAYARLSYTLDGQTADGLNLTRSEAYDVLKESELPSEEQFLAAVQKSLAELQTLSQAPEAEPMTAPAILKNRAMAVFVHEVLGHRVEGFRQKDDAFGKTFTDKVGQPVVSPLLTIVDDATLAYFDGVPLRGFYEYDDEGVKATFFIIGMQAETRKNIVEREHLSGHTVAVHSYTHDYSNIYRSAESLIADIDRCNDVIAKITGARADIYRFPGGSFGLKREFIDAVTKHGMRYVDWNASTRDAESAGDSENLFLSAVATSTDSDRIILLSHDSTNKTFTPEATRKIIRHYKANGYTFKAL